MQQKLEKAKELIKKLRVSSASYINLWFNVQIHVSDLCQCEQMQARVLELEKELEDKENSLLRDLRSSKKFKADHIKSGNVTANNAFTSLSSVYLRGPASLFSFVQNQSAASNDPHASANPSPNQSHWPSG